MLIVVPEDTVPGSKASRHGDRHDLKEATSGYRKGRILILQLTPIVDSNVEPKRALSCILEA